MDKLWQLMHSVDCSLGLERANALIEKNYTDVLSVSRTPLVEFFYPLMVGTFWNDDVDTVDYLTFLIAEKFSSMDNIPHTRREFTDYVFEHRLRPAEYGDLALLNTGIFYKYNVTRRKGLDIEYFRSVGQEQYSITTGGWASVHKRLSTQFLHYEQGLREMSARHIYGRPTELFLNQLIDSGLAAKRKPTEENLLRLERIRNL